MSCFSKYHGINNCDHHCIIMNTVVANYNFGIIQKTGEHKSISILIKPLSYIISISIKKTHILNNTFKVKKKRKKDNTLFILWKVRLFTFYQMLPNETYLTSNTLLPITYLAHVHKSVLSCNKISSIRTSSYFNRPAVCVDFCLDTLQSNPK